MMLDSIAPDDIRKLIETYVQGYSETQQMPDYWRKPLAAFAVADDRFRILPEIAAPDHALPEELLPGGRTVIVFLCRSTKHWPKKTIMAPDPAGTGAWLIRPPIP